MIKRFSSNPCKILPAKTDQPVTHMKIKEIQDIFERFLVR